MQTVPRSGVQTLVVSEFIFAVKQHFDGGNSQKLGEKKFTSNNGNMSINTIELNKPAISNKDTKIKEKDEQIEINAKIIGSITTIAING